MWTVNVAINSVSYVDAHLISHVTATSLRNGTRKIVPSLKIWHGSWRILRVVPNANAPSKRIKVAIIWRVRHAKLNFVGCAWMNGKPMAQPPVATTNATSMKRKPKRTRISRRRKVKERKLNTNLKSTCSTMNAMLTTISLRGWLSYSNHLSMIKYNFFIK